MKKATTLEEQIEILKSRNMIINDEEKAKEVLLDIGYYRLGFYWFPFETDYPKTNNRTHKFKKNTSLNDALALYYFDTDIRNVLIPYLYRIECNFRSYIIYTISNRYKDNPIWYCDNKVMDSKFIKSIPAIYSTINNNDTIKRHHKKYPEDIFAPAWKTLEYIMFGDLLSLYSGLKDKQLQNDIAQYYGLKNTDTFLSYMNTIRIVRNYCAHGNTLFDIKLARRIKRGPISDLTVEQSGRLTGALKAINYILSQISQNRAKDMMKKIEEIKYRSKFERIRRIIDNII